MNVSPSQTFAPARLPAPYCQPDLSEAHTILFSTPLLENTRLVLILRNHIGEREVLEHSVKAPAF